MIGIISTVVSFAMIVVEKIHKHKWTYKYTSRDQDGCVDYEVYECEKCFKIKKVKT